MALHPVTGLTGLTNAIVREDHRQRGLEIDFFMEGADTALLLILLRLATQVQARTQQAAGEGQGRHLLVIAHVLNLAAPPQPLQGADSRGIDGQYAFARQEPQ